MNTPQNGMPLPAERPHHPFSPSKTGPLQHCPCYDGRAGSSEAAELGTRQHTATEKREDDATLDDTRMEHVAECLEFYDRRLYEMQARDIEIAGQQLRAAGHTESQIATALRTSPPEPIELMEVYLPIDDELHSAYLGRGNGPGKLTHFLHTTAGYMDRAILSAHLDYAEAIDWKFGRWPVPEAAQNTQGMCYALGLWHKYPTLKQIKFFFKQPALDYLTSVVWDREKDYDRLYTQIKLIVARAIEARERQDYFSAANPGIPACNFCAHLGRCPKVAEQFLAVCRKYAPVKVPDNVSPTQLLSGPDASYALALAGLAKSWAEALRQVVTDTVLNGMMAVPPGQAIATTVRRKIVDKQAFEKTAIEVVGEEKYRNTLEPEFGKVEKLIEEQAKRGHKAAALREFDARLREAKAIEDSAPIVFLRAVATKESTKTT